MKSSKVHGAKQAHAERKPGCGAKTRAGGECKHPKGFRTDHPGSGRCWLHGGRHSQKKGNTSAVTHGLTRADTMGKAQGLRLIRPDRQQELDDGLATLLGQSDAEVCLNRTRARLAYLHQCLEENELAYSVVVARAVERDVESTRETKTVGEHDEQKQKVSIDQGRVRERYERNRISLSRQIREETQLLLEATEKCRSLGLMQEGESSADILAGVEFPDGSVAPVFIGDGASLADMRAAIDTSSRPPSDPDVDPTQS